MSFKDGPLPFWFQACQRTFRRVSTLRSHRKRCRGGLGVGSGANGENNQCSICHKIVRPERLNSHYAFEHVCKVLPVTQFFCPHDFIIDIREPVLSLVKLQFAIELIYFSAHKMPKKLIELHLSCVELIDEVKFKFFSPMNLSE